MDNYRWFNCFGSFNWQSTQMMREKMKLKGPLSQRTLQNCVPWAQPLCIVDSFFRDQSRMKGDDIFCKRPNLSYPLQLVFAWEKFLCFPAKICLFYSFQPCMSCRHEFQQTYCHFILYYPDCLWVSMLLSSSRNVSQEVQLWVTAMLGCWKARTWRVFVSAKILLYGNEFRVRITGCGSWCGQQMEWSSLCDLDNTVVVFMTTHNSPSPKVSREI